MPHGTILVFGASGQDGSLLRASFAASDVNIVSAPRYNLGGEPPSTWLTRILTDTLPTQIYYLSAIHGSSQSSVNSDYNLIEQHFVVNSLIPSLLPKVLSSLNLSPSIFFASSCHIYAKSLLPLSETSPYAPLSIYADCKLFTTQSLLRASDFFGIHTVSGVLFPHDSAFRSDSFLLPRIVNHAINCSFDHSTPAIAFGNIDQQLDIMDARDTAAASIHVLSHIKTGVVNIGSGHSTTVRTLLSIAFSYFALDYHDFISYVSEDSSPTYLSDISLLRSTGWSPKYHVSDTIRSLIEHRLARRTSNHSL